MAKTKIWGYKCLRCGHEWLPHGDNTKTPKWCPYCKSPYWNRPKRSLTGESQQESEQG